MQYHKHYTTTSYTETGDTDLTLVRARLKLLSSIIELCQAVARQ